jgi:hypothetical protein
MMNLLYPNALSLCYPARDEKCANRQELFAC